MLVRKLVPYLLMLGLLLTMPIFSSCGSEKETITITTTLPAITSTVTTTITSTQPPVTSTSTITSTQQPTTITVTSTQTTTIVEEKSAPMSGEWTASIDIGDIWFIVNEDGTGITEYGIHIPGELSCGNITASGVTITFFYPQSSAPITNSQFNLERSTNDGWDILLEGTFNTTGTQASGIWQINSGETNCVSGTWTSTMGF